MLLVAEDCASDGRERERERDRERQLVGLALAFVRALGKAPPVRPARVVELEAMAVRAAWRRHGVGKALVEGVETWAAERGAAWMELGVYEFNAEARAFYRSLGFETLSRRLRRRLP